MVLHSEVMVTSSTDFSCSNSWQSVFTSLETLLSVSRGGNLQTRFPTGTTQLQHYFKDSSWINKVANRCTLFWNRMGIKQMVKLLNNALSESNLQISSKHISLVWTWDPLSLVVVLFFSTYNTFFHFIWVMWSIDRIA